MIGLRVLAVPLRPGLAMLNGLAAIHPVLGVEYSPQAPYPLAGDLEVNGVRLSDAAGVCPTDRTALRLSCAELVSRFRLELDGTVVDVEVLTLASRSHPCLMLQEVAVEVSRSCELAMTALVATARCARPLRGARVGVRSGGDEVADGDLRFEPPGAMSSAGIAYSTELLGTSDAQRELADWAGNGDLATTYRLSARRGRRYRLRHACGHGAEHAAPTGRPARGPVVERRARGRLRRTEAPQCQVLGGPLARPGTAARCGRALAGDERCSVLLSQQLRASVPARRAPASSGWRAGTTTTTTGVM